MFGWLRKRRGTPTAAEVDRAIIIAALEAISKLGDLMERHAGLIMDSVMLPVPKPQMKAALRIAWKVAVNQEQREAIEISYLGLANFQDGVGNEPINMMLSKTASPSEVIATLGPALVWMNKTTEEMQLLRTEFESFKRAQ